MFLHSLHHILSYTSYTPTARTLLQVIQASIGMLCDPVSLTTSFPWRFRYDSLLYARPSRPCHIFVPFLFVILTSFDPAARMLA